MKKILSVCALSWIALCFGCALDGHDQPRTVVVQPEDITNIASTYIDDIVFDVEGISSSNHIAVISDHCIRIGEAGDYRLSGSNPDSQVIVDAGDDDTVRLVFDDLQLTSLNSPPILIQNAKKVIIYLMPGTENSLQDSAASQSEERACLFSRDDLTITGEGSLEINANLNHGIKANDDLLIWNTTLNIDATNHAISVHNQLGMSGASITLTSGGDGIHVENDTEPLVSLLHIDSGSLVITSAQDSLSSSGEIWITGGTLNLTSGVNSTSATTSMKGIKASHTIWLSGGTYVIRSQEDGIHSNGQITIDGGEYSISAKDDGIHADNQLIINGGTITISESYEGIESKDIVIMGGLITIKSSDDGVNATGDHTTTPGQFRPGGMMEQGNGSLLIEGGTLIINAYGDGIDVNGSIKMTDGLVLISGPTSSNNGAIDYDNSFSITGGTLVACGSAGMAQNVSSATNQASILVNLPSSQSVFFRIVDASGENIVTFYPGKSCQSFLVSSPKLQRNTTYSIYYGGTMTNTVEKIGGLYLDGTYSSGTFYQTVTLNSSITNLGSVRR